MVCAMGLFICWWLLIAGWLLVAEKVNSEKDPGSQKLLDDRSAFCWQQLI